MQNFTSMIKKTLYFGNPTYLSLKNNQIVIRLPEVEQSKNLSDSFKQEAVKTIPIEDIGMVIIDHKQITFTSGLMENLLANNCSIVTCDSNRMPSGMMLPLVGNTTQTERFRYQIEASVPLKKQLWQQTVQAKIENQAFVLENYCDTTVKNMFTWAKDVKSGDPDNYEARAAVYYWANIFPRIEGFVRSREGEPPNHLLNYGYAILRAVIARSLVASGLMPSLGIFHKNKYNAYCLADDIMEPFRPFVDKLIINIMSKHKDISVITKDIKMEMLGIPVLDVVINKQRSPLMIAASQTTASLARCYMGECRKITYPSFE
jgi:CRISPR-associated protein Cas1